MQAGKGAMLGWRFSAVLRPPSLPLERATETALIGVGLVAAAAVPALLLVSLRLELAVAVPTVLAAGYFVVAQSLAARPGRQVGLWPALIFGGLVAWTLYFYGIHAASSWPNAAIALIGPLLAAAPSLAVRAMAAPASEPAPIAAPKAGDTAEIILDREGRVREATDAARALLDSAAIATGRDAARLIPLFERPAFLDAIRAGRTGPRRWPISPGDRPARALEAILEAAPDGSFRMTIQDLPGVPSNAAAPSLSRGVAAAASAETARHHTADLAEAISIACRVVSKRAEGRRVSLVNRCAPGRSASAPSAALDAATCRDILAAFLAAATEQSAPGGRVEIACRTQRGAIVVRASGAGDTAAGAETASDMRHDAARRADAAGGSMLVSRAAEASFALELRLPVRYPPDMRRERQGKTHELDGEA